MFICPQCNVPLAKMKGAPGVFWRCTACDGRSATVALLRKNVPVDVVNSLWQAARTGDHAYKRHCPACNRLMAEVPSHGVVGTQNLDVCTGCQFIWFDPAEYESLPLIPQELTWEQRLPPKAREELALLEMESIREKARGGDWGEETPDAWWQWIPGLLGMPIEQEIERPRHVPWLTWMLTLLISTVSILAFFDLEATVKAFGLVPAQFGRSGGLTLLSSFLLHGGAFHLIGNMYFLLVFGDNVEDWLGKGRFLLLLIFASLAGDALHVLGDPHSSVPCIGASGGISGVIAFYALAFPRARLGVLVHVYLWFRWIRMPAYAMFIIWTLLQAYGAWAQLAGFSNVSSLAHLGGAAVGFVFWLLSRKR